jgi:hypothetical protein
MRTILLVLVVSCQLLVVSCATPRIFAPAPEPAPAVVRLDSLGALSAGKIKFNGPVTLQVGQGNTASTTRTDNTGRSASQGANGGQSVAITDSKLPLWVFCLVLAAGAVLASWIRGKWQIYKASPRVKIQS